MNNKTTLSDDRFLYHGNFLLRAAMRFVFVVGIVIILLFADFDNRWFFGGGLGLLLAKAWAALWGILGVGISLGICALFEWIFSRNNSK